MLTQQQQQEGWGGEGRGVRRWFGLGDGPAPARMTSAGSQRASSLSHGWKHLAHHCGTRSTLAARLLKAAARLHSIA